MHARHNASKDNLTIVALFASFAQASTVLVLVFDHHLEIADRGFLAGFLIAFPVLTLVMLTLLAWLAIRKSDQTHGDEALGPIQAANNSVGLVKEPTAPTADSPQPCGVNVSVETRYTSG